MGIHLPLPTPRLNYGQLVNRACHLNDGIVLRLQVLPQRGKGNTWFDDSGKSNHGTLTGGPTWGGAMGRPGGLGSLNLDGVDDYVDCGDIPAFDSQTYLSVFAWARITTQDGRISSIVHKQDTVTAAKRWSLSPSQPTIGDDDDILVLLGSDGNNAYGYTSAGILPLNTWTHVGFVFDGTGAANADRLKIYVNGLAASVTYNATIPASTADQDGSLWFGRYPGQQYFPGQIDDMRILTRACSASDVTAIYQDSLRGYNKTLNRVQSRAAFDQGGGAAAMVGRGLTHSTKIYRRSKVA